MYEIKYVYTNNKGMINVYTPSDMPLEVCIDKSVSSIQYSYMVVIYDTEARRDIGLDAMTLLQERCTPGTRTWESFLAQMDIEYWRRVYEVPSYGFIPGTVFPYKAPTQIIVPTVDWVNIDYLNMKTPDYRNQFHLKYRQPDLCVSFKVGTPDDIDLKNCLPVCNGFTTQPIHANNEMYIPNGTKYLWETTDLYRPDVFLLDFTPVGGLVHITPMREHLIKYGYRTDQKLLSTDWKIVFDDRDYLKKYTVLVVINGIILFPHEYDVVNTNVIRINPHTLPLDVQMMTKFRAEGTPETVVTNPMTVEEYMLDHIFTTDCVDAYTVSIPNTDLYIYKTFNHHLYATSGLQYQKKLPHPLLRNRSTGQIHYYHMSDYSKADSLENPTKRQLYYFDTPFKGNSTGSDTFPSKRIHHFKDVVDQEYETIYFTTSINH